MNKKHFQKLEKMYLNANINTMIFDTTTCKVLDGYAEIGLNISEKYFHGLGAIHGSVYFKLLDDAAFFAANSKSEYFILTTSFNLNFLKPVKKGRIKAIGKLKFATGNSFIAESKLFNENGNEVAFGTGSFLNSKIPLNQIDDFKY
ncbi:MAG: thioesterase [Crocinitomicaceae bacterium]|nr:thioesterase [Crocinitomicaceae bacterium]